MRYRVDELAARSGVTVDTVRFYQSRGLLPPPERRGRLAYYSDDHVERLRRIRDLKAKGLTLAAIRRVLAGELDAPDRALVGALVEELPGGASTRAEELISLDKLSRRTGAPTALLAAIAREGLLHARTRDGESVYTSSDVETVAAGMALLGAGLPLSELLALARDHHEAIHEVAQRAVEVFIRFVRDPIRASALDETDAAGKMVDAFRKMLGATRALVSNHFERVLLAEALSRIEREGDQVEIDAVRAHAEQGLEKPWPA